MSENPFSDFWEEPSTEGGSPESNLEEDSDQLFYEYFDSINERRDIAHFSKELASYLEKENIENIIFLDRSARLAWIGVDEYYKQHFKEKQKPGYYFLNPDVFRKESKIVLAEGVSTDQAMTDILISKLTGRQPRYIKRSVAKQDSLTVEDFDSVFKNLANVKDKPIVVFDTCSHSGKTMKPVLKKLKEFGFEDIRALTANTPDDTSGVEIAAQLDANTLMTSCYPFGRASGVEKTDGMVTRRRKGPREDVLQARKEIRAIVRDYAD